MSSLSNNKAMMIILSSPSGGGKTSISKKLLAADSKLSFSISATTRKPRSEEKEGVHYFFKDRTEFDRMSEQGEFLEQTNIYGNSYGTPIGTVENELSKGQDVLFDIDSKGACQIKNRARKDVISIFITPPDLDALATRLSLRAQDTPEIIAQRLKIGAKEIEQAKNYDYIVVNDDLNRAVKEIQEIIKKERQKRERY